MISVSLLTNASYEEDIQLLEKRFGDKQIVIFHHMEIVIDQPKSTASEELHKPRMLYDKTEGTVRSLKGMGIDTISYSTFITPVIMSKFPQELCIIISRKW